MTPDTTTVNRPSAYVDDQGRICYRASAIGGCSRALLAARLGLTPVSIQSWLQDKLDESREMEADVVDQYMEEYHRRDPETWPALDHAPDDKPMMFKLCETVNGPVYVTGHGDAFEPRRGFHFAIGEIKAVGQSMYRGLVRDLPSLERHPAYSAQLSSYIQGYGLDQLVHSSGRRVSAVNRAIYLVRNKDTGDLHAQLIEPPALAVQVSDLVAKVQAVEKLVKAGSMSDSCDVRSFLCPFPYLHDELEVDELEGRQAEVFDALCEEYRGLKAQEDRASELRKELGGAIARYMREKGERAEDGKLRVGGLKYVSTLVENPGQRRISEELIRAKGLDPEEFKKAGDAFSYPLIRERGEE